MNNGTQYWFLSEGDYANLATELAAAGYDGLFDFGTPHHVESGSYKGWYFDLGEIDNDEMEWLYETFTSFDLRVVNLSVQAGWNS